MVSLSKKEKRRRIKFGANDSPDFIFKGLLIVLFIAPFLYFSQLYDNADLAKKAFIQMAMPALMFLWFVWAYQQTKQVFIFPWVNLALLLLLFTGFLLIFQSQGSYISLLQNMHWLACFLVFVLAVNLIDDEQKLRWSLATLALASTAISLHGILQHLFSWNWPPQAAPPASFFINKNAASVVTVMGFPPAVILFFTGEKRFKNFWIVAATLIALYILYSSTRASWVGIITEILILLFCVLSRQELRKQILSRTVVGLAAFAVVVFLIFVNFGPNGWEWNLPKIQERVSSIGYFNKQQSRFTLWSNTLLMAAQHPFVGVGVDNFRTHYQEMALISKEGGTDLTLDSRPIYAHNDYLQLTTELGMALFLVITALFLFFLLPEVWNILAVSTLTTPVEIYRLAALLGLIGLAIDACFSFPFYCAIPPFWGAVLLGIMIYKEPVGNTQRSFVMTPRPVIFKWLSLFFAVIFIGWTFCLIRILESDAYFRRQALAIQGADAENVLFWGQKVQEYNPYRVDTIQSSCQGYLVLQKYREAVTACERYRKIYPLETYNLFHLAESYKGLGELDQAEVYLKLAMQLTDDSRLYESMVGIHLKRGHFEEALAQMKKAIERDPKNERLQDELKKIQTLISL